MWWAASGDEMPSSVVTGAPQYSGPARQPYYIQVQAQYSAASAYILIRLERQSCSSADGAEGAEGERMEPFPGGYPRSRADRSP